MRDKGPEGQREKLGKGGTGEGQRNRWRDGGTGGRVEREREEGTKRGSEECRD